MCYFFDTLLLAIEALQLLRFLVKIKRLSYSEDEDYTPKKQYKKEPKTSRTNSTTVDGTLWTCKLCNKEFGRKRDLNQHRKTHIINETEDLKYSYDPLQELYTCNNCSAEFHEEQEVEKHMDTHIEKYSCEDCKSVIVGAYNFSIHVQQHRDDKLFVCPKCTYRTPTKTRIYNHMKTLHFHEYDFQCAKCGKYFNDGLLYKEHENVHLGIKPFICIVCNKGFIYTRYLVSHQIRMHRVRVVDQNSKTQCCFCSKVFAKPDSLKRHLLKHEPANVGKPGKKKFLCDVCGQGFSRTDKLKIHYRKHTGDKPYACEYCEKSFIKRDYLIMHERIHSGEKPYSCEYCGKCFNQGAPLRIHMRGHTGERPYACPYCGVGCVSKGAVNSHVKSCVGYL